MKKRRISKKLELNKETLRKLTSKELEQVVGGEAEDPDTANGGGGCLV
jgi:bacteriocin-like protein